MRIPCAVNIARKLRPAVTLRSSLPLIAVVAGAAVMIALALRPLVPAPRPDPAPALLAEPSAALLADLADRAVPFERAIVQQINETGRVTVTAHVALHESRSAQTPRRFGDGNDPASNLYWGALYGVERHLANSDVWRRVHADAGDGRRVIRRAVFHRLVEPGPTWRKRGATRPFDLFVLANAWPASRTLEAMRQPLIDALGGTESTVIRVGGDELAFGSASIIVGYVGRNLLADERVDLFAGLAARPRAVQSGVFYAAPQSAVYLHRTVVEHGLYPVLFTREPIVPEAYLLDGVLRGVAGGKLGDGLLDAAARQYALYQKGLTRARARAMLFR